MSLGENITSEKVEDAMHLLFAGREPRERWLARCATLDPWRVYVRDLGRGPRVVVDGTLVSGRFRVKHQPKMPVILLWMDRRWRFVVTPAGLWQLGALEEDVSMDLKLPVQERADE
jgi:hypothetical protein